MDSRESLGSSGLGCVRRRGAAVKDEVDGTVVRPVLLELRDEGGRAYRREEIREGAGGEEERQESGQCSHWFVA